MPTSASSRMQSFSFYFVLDGSVTRERKDRQTPCSPRRRKVRGIRSIFKATAIFDSYSPRPWFRRHLFHDPPASVAHTHVPRLALTRARTHTHTHGKQEGSVESVGRARLRSTDNCTMPADTPPISEHQLCSTPSLCSTLAPCAHEPF